MFNQITWAGYFTALLILLLGYYLYVLFFYYKDDLTQLISGKQKLFVRSHQSNLENGLFPLVHDLTKELQMAIRQAGEKAYKKEELLFSLQLLLKKYTELKGTNFTEAINNLIAVECQNSCSIHLNEDELSMLWVQ